MDHWPQNRVDPRILDPDPGSEKNWILGGGPSRELITGKQHAKDIMEIIPKTLDEL